MEHNLSMIAQEFHLDSTPYERKSKDIQVKINRIMNYKAQDIKTYSKSKFNQKALHA